MNSEPFVRAGIISVLLLVGSTAEPELAGLRPIQALQIQANSMEPPAPHRPGPRFGLTAARECKRRCASDHLEEFARHSPASRRNRWSSRQRNIRAGLCATGLDDM